MNSVKNDLTEGSIGRKLISFFLPIAAGTLFQQLYNAADAIVVGKFVGTIALAAVGGSAANITNLLIGFFVALSGGSTVVIAQLFGAKDEESIQKATGTAVAFCIISGIVLTVVGIADPGGYHIRSHNVPSHSFSRRDRSASLQYRGGCV